MAVVSKGEGTRMTEEPEAKGGGGAGTLLANSWLPLWR